MISQHPKFWGALEARSYLVASGHLFNDCHCTSIPGRDERVRENNCIWQGVLRGAMDSVSPFTTISIWLRGFLGEIELEYGHTDAGINVGLKVILFWMYLWAYFLLLHGDSSCMATIGDHGFWRGKI